MYIKVESGKVLSVSFVEQDDSWIEVPDMTVEEIGDPEEWYWNGTEMYRDEDKKTREYIDGMLISSIKQSLNDSDYQILKFAESLLEVNSITDLLSLIIRTRAELRDIVRQRAEWRRQINELEEEDG